MTEERARIGVKGLDDIAGGGLPQNHMYLIEGEPGTGKTTLALQFLMEGVKLGEPVLYVTLSETNQELIFAAASHGWSLDGISIVELSSFDRGSKPESQYTVLSTAEVELTDVLAEIRTRVEELRPRRVVFDSLSEMRLLARDPLRFRREILNLKQFFAERNATVFLLDDRTIHREDLQLQSVAHGIVRLERCESVYGADRRRLAITKLRGSRYRDGFHDYKIATGGLIAYPRLVASEYRSDHVPGAVLSGVSNLDELLGGGLERGTSTLILGPAGTGKSTIAITYAIAAAQAGERAAVYLFDENLGTLRARCRGLEIPLDTHIESGLIHLQQIDPTQMSPGEFIQLIRDAVEQEDFRTIVIDSLVGFINAMPDERMLMLQLHELLTYLNQANVTTLMTTVQHGLVGQMTSSADLSYLADTLILLRFFEAAGQVRLATSVLKKRTGVHEKTIREMKLGKGGISVGKPLDEFQGILTGVPRFVGGDAELMERERARSGS